MEFDKSKILTVVTADQAKVGSMGYFSNYIPTLEGYVTGHIKPDKLIRVSLNTILYPFFDGYDYYSLFYPAQEPTYAERQAQWVKENNVKEGTKVRVTRTFTEDEDGSSCCEHDDLVGMTGIIREYGILPHNLGLSHSLGVTMSDGNMRAIPYFALEVIKEPYRPYNNDELNDLVGKVLIQNHTGNAMMAIKVVDGEAGKLISLSGSQKRNAQQLLDGWTHKNGEPCGVRVE